VWGEKILDKYDKGARRNVQKKELEKITKIDRKETEKKNTA
jgi:hypothetical protein